MVLTHKIEFTVQSSSCSIPSRIYLKPRFPSLQLLSMIAEQARSLSTSLCSGPIASWRPRSLTLIVLFYSLVSSPVLHYHYRTLGLYLSDVRAYYLNSNLILYTSIPCPCRSFGNFEDSRPCSLVTSLWEPSPSNISPRRKGKGRKRKRCPLLFSRFHFASFLLLLLLFLFLLVVSV